MKSMTQAQLATGLLVFLLASYGCGAGTLDDATSIASAIESDNGLFSNDSELPDFGDALTTAISLDDEMMELLEGDVDNEIDSTDVDLAVDDDDDTSLDLFETREAPDRLPNHAVGLVKGGWKPFEDSEEAPYGKLGKVYARFKMVHNSDMTGAIKGYYGVRKNGVRVVVGKVIDANGRFVGLFRGHYRLGRVRARIFDKAGHRVGLLRLKQIRGPERDFLGRIRIQLDYLETLAEKTTDSNSDAMPNSEEE